MRFSPMLATPASELPSGADFVFEPKWDGMRTLLRVSAAGRVDVWSRRSVRWTHRLPDLAGIGAVVGRSCLLDGETVVMGPDGRPSFELLMRRLQSSLPSSLPPERAPATFVAFDVLELDGNDVTGASWSERRGVLDALGLDGTRAVVTMASDDGEALLRATGRLGVEGVVAKRRGSRYVCGRRTGAWVKVKHRRTGWYDVAGWRLSRRGRPGGIVVADDGRVVGTAFVALPAGERHVLHELIARHGVAAGDVIHMPPGVQVRVDYLERTTTGSLREAIGRALRPTP